MLKKNPRIAILQVGLFCLAFSYCTANNWYVDNAVSTGGNSGASWKDAWKSFSAINWGSVKPGDTINISGGKVSQVYEEKLTIGASGSSLYIVIRPGQDDGHNGVVIIDGKGSRNSGICFSSRSNFKISGRVGADQACKMLIQNHTEHGIDGYGKLTNIVLEYLEVNNNGTSQDMHGINISPDYNANYNIEIAYCKVHDNYQDALHVAQNKTGEGTQFGSFRIHHNDLYNIADDGIEISVNCDVYNNKIHGRILKGNGHPDGIQFYNSYSRVFNNEFYDFVHVSENESDISNAAIFFDPFDASCTLQPKFVYIYNNVIYEKKEPIKDEYYRGIAVKLAEPGVTGGSDIIVANNTLYGIPFYAISLTTNAFSTDKVSNIQIVNNAIYNCCKKSVGYCVLVFGSGDGSITYGSCGDNKDVTVDYNTFYGNPNECNAYVDFKNSVENSLSDFRNSTGALRNSFITTDPLMDTSYYLKQSSPLINKGFDMSTYFTTDKDGYVRSNFQKWDIGAYEYRGTIGIINKQKNDEKKVQPKKLGTVINRTNQGMIGANNKYVYDLFGRIYPNNPTLLTSKMIIVESEDQPGVQRYMQVK